MYFDEKYINHEQNTSSDTRTTISLIQGVVSYITEVYICTNVLIKLLNLTNAYLFFLYNLILYCTSWYVRMYMSMVVQCNVHTY